MKNINTNLPSESRKTPSVKLSKIKSSVVLAPELIKPRKTSPDYPFIQIHVGTLTGKVLDFFVHPKETVGNLKERIYADQGININQQMIVFCGKELSNNELSLKEFGIQEHSTLQLVVQMNGGNSLLIGPTPVINVVKEEDQMVFLLCKQNQEIFVLEVHLKDGHRPQTVTKHQLRFETPTQNNKLFDLIGSNECFDISDLCELQPVTPISRETFSGSDHGSGSFDTRDLLSGSRETGIGSNYERSESFISRGSSEAFTEPIEELINDNMFWESEWLTTDKTDIHNRKLNKVRPATAISLMRLPSGSKSMIIIPKTRPSSAEKFIEGFKTHLESKMFTPKTKTCIPTIDPVQKQKSEPLNFFSEDRKKYKNLMSKPIKHTPLKFKKQTPPKNLEFTSKLKTPKKELNANTRTKCLQCNKKLGPAQVFICKCKHNFCGIHRYSDRHNCDFDYKLEGKVILEKANPVVKKEKCIKL